MRAAKDQRRSSAFRRHTGHSPVAFLLRVEHEIWGVWLGALCPIVQAVVTSPPYWKQRRYTQSSEEFGRSMLDAYVTQLVDLFDYAGELEVRPPGAPTTGAHFRRTEGAVWPSER